MGRASRRVNAAVYFLQIVVAFLILFPLLFAIVSSIRPLNDIFKYVSPVTWRTFLPTGVTMEAYEHLFTERNFGTVLFNTFYVALMTVVFGVWIGSMAAFAFAKFHFPGKHVLFGLVLITFMIPFEVIAIPLYGLVNQLGWIDTYYGIVVPAVANGLVIFLFRQFFLDLPDALIESARMDGASWVKIYTSIIMPLSKPVTVSAALMLFISQWESFMWPLIATRSKQYKVIQVAMSDFSTEHATIWNELFAASVIAFIIPILLLLPLQRFFIQGVTNTGVKE
ncbi:carbohydrate ABC transporter permease [Paenibacillus filicis]|uniref:Carbohydrate ABC transporter permease n=1 Tax=Paenibacillus gyeongsangnamensis TaxID=3388067 RepID=A0ABT4QFF8_9BACL|nr:carbohydrate ABC transporter permease [Paenibacillus filicis]MCZ8515481.1 carbohydrate ABC transporter permease [Paenibacillus filicis]